jgi:hypothetical protein
MRCSSSVSLVEEACIADKVNDCLAGCNHVGAAREERKRDGGTLNKERLAAAGIKASMGHDGEEQLVYLLPPSSYYEESTHGCHQLTADSPLRVVIAQAIHHRRRRILFDGQDPLTLVDPDLA